MAWIGQLLPHGGECFGPSSPNLSCHANLVGQDTGSKTWPDHESSLSGGSRHKDDHAWRNGSPSSDASKARQGALGRRVRWTGSSLEERSPQLRSFDNSKLEPEVRTRETAPGQCLRTVRLHRRL